MAQLPTIIRISKEDVPGSPAWIDGLLYPENLFKQQVYSALNHSLTFGQNWKGETKIFEIVGSSVGTENIFTFASNAVEEPRSIQVAQIVRTDRAPIAFTQAPWVDAVWEAPNIRVYNILGLTDGVSYTITLDVHFR